MATSLDRATAAAAVTAMLARTAATAEEVGDLFPLHADPTDGRWTTTRRGSWVGGFWAGLLWLAAEHDPGRSELRLRAREVTARLRERAHDDTDTRAMTFWYGAARGHLRCGDVGAARVAVAGAAAVAASAHPRYGVIPAGTALGRGARGASELTVDAAAAVIALLAWAGRQDDGQPSWVSLADVHARAVRDRCLAADGGIRASVALDDTGDTTPAGEWARGQAWGILALATAARVAEHETPGGAKEFTDAALLAADYWAERTGHRVPTWDLRDSGGPRDTSAAAIAAEALCDLADLVPEPRGGALRQEAGELLAAVVAGHLVAGGPIPGRLLDGCYNAASGTAVAHELIWGDYFLLSALTRIVHNDGRPESRAAGPA